MYGWTGQILTGAGEPVRLASVRATPSLGDVLGVAPRLGRWFTTDDVRPGAPRTVVLSHALWRGRFGGDEGVVGRMVQLDEVPHEVVGVMPRDFTFPDREASLWTPLPVPETGLGGWNFKAVGRLAAGADATAAERELTALLPKLREVSDDPARVAVVLAGTAAGLVAALALSRLMESLLVGVSPTDPLSFSLLTALLLAVATGALWLPARRAARVSPSTALRSE